MFGMASPFCRFFLLLPFFTSAGSAEYSPGLTRIGVTVSGSGLAPKLDYVALPEILDAFQMRGQADPLTGVQWLKGASGAVSLCPGMREILINGKL